MSDQQEKKTEKFVLTGKIYWAHVHEPNKLSNKFQVDLSVDSQTLKMLEKLGIDIKNYKDNPKSEGEPDERGDYVTLKSAYPPRLVDSQKNPVAASVLLGNGSKVNVLTHVYEWKFGKKSGLSLGLDAIQVVELVEYNDTMVDAFEAVDGFTSSATSETTTDESEVSVKVSKDNPF